MIVITIYKLKASIILIKSEMSSTITEEDLNHEIEDPETLKEITMIRDNESMQELYMTLMEECNERNIQLFTWLDSYHLGLLFSK